MLDFAGPREGGHDSLAVMGEAMARLGDPQERLRVVHITGTSGKTSTAYHIRDVLGSAGRRTGMTVSPHITAVNERIQIAGRPWPEPEFCRDLEAVLDRLAGLEGRLTYFELVTALALWSFDRAGVDYAVVEVGIGGALDATNILRRPDKAAVIGPVGLDHTEKLGNTIGAIAAHKAGIIVEGGVVFVARQPDEALDVILREAARRGATSTIVEPPVDDPADGLTRFQRRNQAMAQAVTRFLAERDGFAVPAAVPLAGVPARFEWLTAGGHRILLDGAHNPQKMAGLVEALGELGIGPLPVLATLTTAPADKIAMTLAALRPVVRHLVIPEFRLGRHPLGKASVPAGEVARIAAELGIAVRVVPDLDEALAGFLAEEAPELLVTGSLYLAALVRARLAEDWTDRVD